MSSPPHNSSLVLGTPRLKAAVACGTAGQGVSRRPQNLQTQPPLNPKPAGTHPLLGQGGHNAEPTRTAPWANSSGWVSSIC